MFAPQSTENKSWFTVKRLPLKNNYFSLIVEGPGKNIKQTKAEDTNKKGNGFDPDEQAIVFLKRKIYLKIWGEGGGRESKWSIPDRWKVQIQQQLQVWKRKLDKHQTPATRNFITISKSKW